MQIFDELKAHGVQEVGFISMDGVSCLEEGSTSNFPRSGCATLHCPPDSQLAKVCPDARLQALRLSLEKNLWCTEP